MAVDTIVIYAQVRSDDDASDDADSGLTTDAYAWVCGALRPRFEVWEIKKED